eukprot:gene1730-biopygen6357
MLRAPLKKMAGPVERQGGMEYCGAARAATAELRKYQHFDNSDSRSCAVGRLYCVLPWRASQTQCPLRERGSNVCGGTFWGGTRRRRGEGCGGHHRAGAQPERCRKSNRRMLPSLLLLGEATAARSGSASRDACSVVSPSERRRLLWLPSRHPALLLLG